MDANHGTPAHYVFPDDYAVLDGGRLLVRPDCVEPFRAFGWRTLADVMDSESVEVVRQLEARDNCRVEIPGPAGPIRGYLKRHRIRVMKHWFLELQRHRAGASPGMAEANAVGWCQQAGVPTMSVIAAGETSLKRQWHSDSMFLSEELAGCVPANNFWFPDTQRWVKPPPQTDEETRLKVLRAVAVSARRFHAAGLFHSDFYLGHFFVDPALTQAHLVDLQRVEHRPRPPARWSGVMKDVGQFYCSCLRYGLTDAERLEWNRWYFGDEEGPRQLTGFDHLRIGAASARWKLRRLRRKFQKRPKKGQPTSRAA